MKISAERLISEYQLNRLLKEMRAAAISAKDSGSNLRHAVDYYLIAITSNTGLRISEVSALAWGDVYDDFLIVRNGKGGKERHVYFGKNTARLFREYDELTLTHGRQVSSGVRLFNGERGPLTRFGIHSRFQYWKKRCGLPRFVTVHSLRHRNATQLLDSGVPLTAVRDQLGHSNISTTSAYLHLTESSISKIKSVF